VRLRGRNGGGVHYTPPLVGPLRRGNTDSERVAITARKEDLPYIIGGQLQWRVGGVGKPKLSAYKVVPQRGKNEITVSSGPRKEGKSPAQKEKGEASQGCEE